ARRRGLHRRPLRRRCPLLHRLPRPPPRLLAPALRPRRAGAPAGLPHAAPLPRCRRRRPRPPPRPPRDRRRRARPPDRQQRVGQRRPRGRGDGRARAAGGVPAERGRGRVVVRRRGDAAARAGRRAAGGLRLRPVRRDPRRDAPLHREPRAVSRLRTIAQRLGLAAAAVLTVGLLAWNPARPTPDDGRTHIRYWYIVGANDDVPYHARRFNEVQDSIVVEATPIPWNEHEKKILTAVLSGDPPDVVSQFVPVVKWASRL